MAVLPLPAIADGGGGTDHLNCVMEMDLCCGNWYKLDQTGLMNSLCVSHSLARRHH